MRKLAIVAAVALAAAGATFVLPEPPGPSAVVSLRSVNDHDGVYPRVVTTNKKSQLKTLIYIADGPGGGIISGPMSRMQAEAEMRDLYPDADAVLLIEDGHGGYIDVKSQQSMQKLLAARDPDWDK